jgi:hypothetical protein
MICATSDFQLMREINRLKQQTSPAGILTENVGTARCGRRASTMPGGAMRGSGNDLTP